MRRQRLHLGEYQVTNQSTITIPAEVESHGFTRSGKLEAYLDLDHDEVVLRHTKQPERKPANLTYVIKDREVREVRDEIIRAIYENTQLTQQEIGEALPDGLQLDQSAISQIMAKNPTVTPR